MIAGCEHGGADMVWRDLVQTVELVVARGKMTRGVYASLCQYLAVEIDETTTLPRVRLARLPRPVAINIPAGLMFGGVREALQRGTDALNALIALYERGTPEDIATDTWARSAAIKWDVVKRRALGQVEWESGLGHRMMLLKAHSSGGYIR